MLWDLGSEKASQVYSGLDTAVKLAWSCPRWTRTFLLQQVLACGIPSAKTDILRRYGKFCRGLRASVCQEVRVMFNLVSRDLQCTTAKNIKFVESSAEVELWTAGSGKLKEELQKNHLVDIPTQDAWRVPYLGTLLMQLQQAKHLAQEDKVKDIQDLIDSLVM